MLQQGVFDILQPEVMLAGRISDVRKIGVLAEAFDRQVTPRCAIEEPIGTIAAPHMSTAERTVVHHSERPIIPRLLDASGILTLREPPM